MTYTTLINMHPNEILQRAHNAQACYDAGREINEDDTLCFVFTQPDLFDIAVDEHDDVLITAR